MRRSTSLGDLSLEEVEGREVEFGAELGFGDGLLLRALLIKNAQTQTRNIALLFVLGAPAIQG
jgi:hypothetical protein